MDSASADGFQRAAGLPSIDTLWVITTFEAFDQRYTGSGLSAEDTAARLVTMAERALSVDPAAR